MVKRLFWLAGVTGLVIFSYLLTVQAGENYATFPGQGIKYRDKATPQELEKEPWLFGNGQGLYVLRSPDSDSGGPVKAGEVKNLILSGYYGWDDNESKWSRDIRFEWTIYHRKKEARIENNNYLYAWKAPDYDSSSEAANTYTITGWVFVKQGDKEVKEGVSWILWIEK